MARIKNRHCNTSKGTHAHKGRRSLQTPLTGPKGWSNTDKPDD